MLKQLAIAVVVLSAASTAPFDTATAQNQTTTPAENTSTPHHIDVSSTVPIENFDFLDGVWRIDSRHRSRRMRHSDRWLQNNLETEYQILLGGLVALNQTYGTFNGGPMHGFMVRTYDPDIDEWTMQWMARGHPHLTEQVRGRFHDGVGEFLGSEVNEGRTFAMRFRWFRLAEDRAYWEQSYQDPETGEWEVNWTMDLNRISKP